MGLHVFRGPESTMKADGPIQHEQSDIVGRCVLYLRSKLLNFLVSYAAYLKIFVVTLVAILYHVYLVAVVQYTQNNNKFEWCNGSGFLYILTAFVYWGLFYYCVLKGLLRSRITTALKPITKFVNPIRKNRYSSSVLTLSCVIGVVAYVVIDAKNDPRRIVSAAGVIAIVGIALLISKHPGRVQWRSVAWGILVQVFLAMVVIRWKTGQDASLCVSEKVTTFLNFAEAGSGFVYGYLASGFNQTISTGDHIELPGIFAFKPLSIIFFFNFIVGFLHHYGILMWLIQKIGWFLEVVIGTTAVESTGAAANVFLGQSEVFLLNKPFLMQMTKSEIHALMTAGLATVAGSEYGLLLSFGISANYLITASLMAAPASLALSKLIYPETEQSVTSAAEMKKLEHRTSISALDAAARGATESVILIGTIIANLVAFIATVAFLNAILGWFSALVGAELTFEMLVGKLFIPFAYITGVDQSEVEDVAVLLGLKTVVNEVVAYRKLVSPEMAHLSARTRVIATHALCSFANIGSVGIQLGAVTFICPERRKDVINTIWYALVSGSLCGLLNACVIGALIS